MAITSTFCLHVWLLYWMILILIITWSRHYVDCLLDVRTVSHVIQLLLSFRMERAKRFQLTSEPSQSHQTFSFDFISRFSSVMMTTYRFIAHLFCFFSLLLLLLRPEMSHLQFISTLSLPQAPFSPWSLPWFKVGCHLFTL